MKCPVNHSFFSKQQTADIGTFSSTAYDIDDKGVWHIYDFALARSILRSNQIRQTGFKATFMDKMPQALQMRKPILYMEGEEHIQLRRKTAKYFTPKKTNADYRHFTESIVDDLMQDLLSKGSYELSDLTQLLSMGVAANIIGLTDSSIPKMAKRLELVFKRSQSIHEFSMNPKLLWQFAKIQSPVIQFYYKDVMPSIKARKKEPKDDLISYLIQKDYEASEILAECLTFAAAGMATTREFVLAVSLHFFEDKELRELFLNSEEKKRYDILEEILRLEPVVGAILRQTTEDLSIEWESETLTIPKDTHIQVEIYGINQNKDLVGEFTERVCPTRVINKKTHRYIYSFGDGHHKCPGSYIAIQESDIFLKKLFSIETLKIASKPNITYSDVVKGYEIRNFKIEV